MPIAHKARQLILVGGRSNYPFGVGTKLILYGGTGIDGGMSLSWGKVLPPPHVRQPSTPFGFLLLFGPNIVLTAALRIDSGH